MPIPDADLQALQLGALLHDIGKLFQRRPLKRRVTTRVSQGHSPTEHTPNGRRARRALPIRALAGQPPIS